MPKTVNAASEIMHRLPVTRGISGLGAMCVLGPLALLSGCASQGPLRPPSLKLPSPVTGLAAERVGDATDLHWMTPSKTTDGVALAGKHGAGRLTAEICRSEAAAANSCMGSGRVTVTAGAPADFHDVLPPDMLSGGLRPLHYRVRVLNGEGKGARYVAVETLAGAAPPAVSGLAASLATDGVALRWQPDAVADGARTVLRVERVRAASAAPAAPHADLLAVEPAAHDSGGAIDAGAKPGVEQRYIVFRTQSVLSGGKTLTASSLPATVTVSASAKAPPPPSPAGFEALVNTLGAPEIDLVWQPAEGAAGYLVFRAEADGAMTRLTAQPMSALSYADSSVRAGVHYRYAVASVGAAGAIGHHSADLIEMVPQP